MNIKINGGNIKLGNMGSFSKVYGNEVVSVGNLSCVGTCGNFCTGCKNECYVKASYRYPSVKARHINNTLAIRESIDASLEALDNQLTRKRNRFQTVRINQSGEIESLEEFKMWIELANRHSETIFYIYTKALDIIKNYILAYGLPSNFILLVSIWGVYGIDSYNELKHLTNIKAFVCITKNYTLDWYKAHGIDVQTSCKAYNEAGKLDHNVTCDKCRKCFNSLSSCKVMGCYEH